MTLHTKSFVLIKSVLIILLSLSFLQNVSLVLGQEGKGGGSEGKKVKPPPTAETNAGHIADKKQLMLNFPIMNRTDMEKNCSKLLYGKCWSSDWLLPVCASNTIVYQNPGVLVCAQVCSPEIELEIFCDPTGAVGSEDLQQCKKCPEKIAQSKAQAAAANAGSTPTGGNDLGGREEDHAADNEDKGGGAGGGGGNNGVSNDGNNATAAIPLSENVPPIESNTVDTSNPDANADTDGKESKKKKKHKKSKPDE